MRKFKNGTEENSHGREQVCILRILQNTHYHVLLPINWHKSNSIYWITNKIYIEGLTEINSTETKRLRAQRKSLGIIYLCANSAQHLPPYKTSVKQAFIEQLLCGRTSCYQALDTLDTQNLWNESWEIPGEFWSIKVLKFCILTLQITKLRRNMEAPPHKPWYYRNCSPHQLCHSCVCICTSPFMALTELIT